MNSRQTGKDKEEAACRYLTEQGFQILAQNFACRQGEIDIIGYHGGYLVFVEVKYRKDDSQGRPEEAVNIRKQRKICKTAAFYCSRNTHSTETPVRYDVVGIMGNQIIWHQNAFEHIESRR